MRRTTEVHILGLQWTPWSQLDDPDFADTTLVLHNHQQMAAEITQLANKSAKNWAKLKQR